jgi:hypothetical protein
MGNTAYHNIIVRIFGVIIIVSFSSPFICCIINDFFILVFNIVYSEGLIFRTSDTLSFLDDETPDLLSLASIIGHGGVSCPHPGF